MQHIISKQLNNVNIVEIGGGYGGLALITLELAKLKNINIVNYIIYDLPYVTKLQQYYLIKHNVCNVQWLNCYEFGKDLLNNGNNVIVSCYCISEMLPEYRKKYLQNLLPKSKAAYFVWNWGSKEDLPKIRDERPEIPDTGDKNTIIRL